MWDVSISFVSLCLGVVSGVNGDRHDWVKSGHDWVNSGHDWVKPGLDWVIRTSQTNLCCGFTALVNVLPDIPRKQGSVHEYAWWAAVYLFL
jgi:hypothetical protein